VYDTTLQQQTDSKAENHWMGYKQPSSNGAQSFDLYGRIPRWPEKSATTFHRTLPDFPFSVCKANGERDPSQADMRFLQFWTWSAHFYLAFANPPSPPTLTAGLERFDITDCNGDWCGTIVITSELSATLDLRDMHEVIALSDAKGFELEEYDGWTYYTPAEREQSAWELYYVLLVQHDDLGIAHRVGLGKVYKDAFQNSCGGVAEWKEFIFG
jgi:hypothetical protein